MKNKHDMKKRNQTMKEMLRHTTRFLDDEAGVKRVPTTKKIMGDLHKVLRRNVVFQVCMLKDDWWSYVPVWCKTKDSLASALFDMSLHCWSCYGVNWDGIYGRFEMMMGPDPRYKTNITAEMVEYLVENLHEGPVQCLYHNPSISD